MNIEILIYMYALLCLSLIGFDCLWALLSRLRNRRIKKVEAEFSKKFEDQLDKITSVSEIDNSQMKYLTKKLKNVDNLKAFHRALEKYNDNNRIEPYLRQLGKLFVLLAAKYEKQQSINKAYFAYVVSQYPINFAETAKSISEILISYLYDKSVYCRENALMALYQFGDEENILRAVKILDNRQVYYNSKLLTDGLFSFKGSHEKLSIKLLENFSYFHAPMQLTIINYFKLTNVDLRGMMFGLLIDKNLHNEIKFALIRYYGKHYFEPAKKVLIDYLLQKNSEEWEFAALSARALSRYEERQVIDVLKSSLSSRNWYVRLNAASSLCEMNVSEDEFLDIINGKDRFAREILQYTFSIRKKNSTKQKTRNQVGIEVCK
ncbi:MAG: HEAT repeat domain-containing protein [Acetobacterium sp.]|uniref:HEAT repeat domain-containing protein n=1 Tax=Acetobacterium sp. TaxID=1872094 RepID=UPI0032422539